MAEKRVQLNQIVQNILPSYVRDEFPLIEGFLYNYYLGQEIQGAPIDLINNIDSYLKLSSNTNLTRTATVTYDVTSTQTNVFVDNTIGFPDSFGLIQIEDEIIFYAARTDNCFVSCTRGLTGITSYENPENLEEVVFSTSEASQHGVGTTVKNLSVLFLDTFLKKIKKQFLPGLEETSLNGELNQAQFIRNSKDFYSTRGTENSFKILFKALFNDEAELVRPKDYVISPSNASYKITKDIVVESLEGNPFNLVNKTLFQDSYENIDKAYAPVSNVEKVVVGTSTDTYYKISIDGSYNQTDGLQNYCMVNFLFMEKQKLLEMFQLGKHF